MSVYRQQYSDQMCRHHLSIHINHSFFSLNNVIDFGGFCLYMTEDRSESGNQAPELGNLEECVYSTAAALPTQGGVVDTGLQHLITQ